MSGQARCKALIVYFHFGTHFQYPSSSKSVPANYPHLPLEEEHLILKLANRVRLGVTQSVQMSLHGIHHRRRATHQNLALGANTTGRHMALDHLTGDEALSACPSCWSVVEDVLNGVIVSLARGFVGDKSKYTYVDLESTVRSGFQVVQLLTQD
jgi:hypothetical protein